MPSEYNPTMPGYNNPWYGQGDVINTEGGYSTSDDAPGKFWDWWDRNGDEATGFLSNVMCMIKPENCRRSQGGNYPPAPAQDNTVLYAMLGLILLLLIVFMFKK